jgi:hypothetical protein
MPEYVAPGLYVEEVGRGPKPIEGVSTSTLAFIVGELRRIMPGIWIPSWTQGNEADPGVTLIEVFAFLAEALFERDTITGQYRKAATRAIAALSRLAEPCGETEGTIRRPSFYGGQLIDEKTLQAEQDYHRGIQRRHNLELHGVGIVRGLGVRVEPATDAEEERLHIEPGYALDGCGHEIVIGRAVVVALPRACEKVYVSLRRWEIPCAPVPSASGESVLSRIEEACVIALVAMVAEPAIALARLVHTEGRWVIDQSFVPRRVTQSSA